MLKSRLLKKSKNGEFAVQFNYEPPFGFKKGSVLWFKKGYKGTPDGGFLLVQFMGTMGYALLKYHELKIKTPLEDYTISLEGGNYWACKDGITPQLIPMGTEASVEGHFIRESTGAEKEELIRKADAKVEMVQTNPYEIYFVKELGKEKDSLGKSG